TPTLFYKDTYTTEIYSLSLHDALPIYRRFIYVERLGVAMPIEKSELLQGTLDMLILKIVALGPVHGYGISQRIRQISKEILQVRSEEHTSELQSRFDLVCRLLLEKKNE